MATDDQIKAAARSLAQTVVSGSAERSPDEPGPGDGEPRWRNWEHCARLALEAAELQRAVDLAEIARIIAKCDLVPAHVPTEAEIDAALDGHLPQWRTLNPKAQKRNRSRMTRALERAARVRSLGFA